MRRGRQVTRHPEDWIIETCTVIHGRHVEPGTELSIDGQRGRFRFVRKVTTPVAAWLDTVGPLANPRSRSFTLDRVKTVHRIRKGRP